MPTTPAAPAKPAEPKRPQLNIADPGHDLRSKIDDLRALQRPVPSQSDLVRALVTERWEAEFGKGKSAFIAELKAGTKAKGRK